MRDAAVAVVRLVFFEEALHDAVGLGVGDGDGVVVILERLLHAVGLHGYIDD